MNNEFTLSRIASIVAGVLSAFGLAYVGIAQVWHLPYGDEINQTIGIVVQFISAVLAAWTGKKITDAKNASKAKAEQSADSTEEVKG